MPKYIIIENLDDRPEYNGQPLTILTELPDGYFNLIDAEGNIFMAGEEEMQLITEKLPPIKMYAKYLQIASIRFGLTIDQCRDKYGLFTASQWEELFNADSASQLMTINK